MLTKTFIIITRAVLTEYLGTDDSQNIQLYSSSYTELKAQHSLLSTIYGSNIRLCVDTKHVRSIIPRPRLLVGHKPHALSSRHHGLQACLVDRSYAGRLVWSAVQCTIIIVHCTAQQTSRPA